MFRNNKVNRIDPIEINDLVMVRSEVLYFLEFVEYTKELFDSQRVKSKPSLIFYTEEATNKLILDYTLSSDEDKIFLKAFFTKMKVGDAFTLTKGGYLDDTNQVEADLSSSLTFNKFSENMVFATVVSTTDKDANVNLYSRDFFITTPQISKNTSLEESNETKIQALISLNPKSTAKPLLSLGYQPDDIIEILSNDSVNNGKRFRIIDAALINDREVIYLETTEIVSESLLGKPVIVNLYQHSKVAINAITQFNDDQATLGCCNSSEVSLPYHTQKQCVLRGDFSWIAGSCLSGTNVNSAVTTTTTTTLTNDAVAQELFDKNVLLLQQSLNTAQYDILNTYFKKKTISDTGSPNGNPLAEYFSVKNAPDQTQFFESFLEENYTRYSVPVVLNNSSKDSLTQAVLPVSIFQQLSGISTDYIKVTTDTNLYKLLNISYEAIITDSGIRVRSFDGTLLAKTEISLSKNIITTIYESNLTGDDGERILFTTDVKTRVPVLDFGSLGYGYLQLGRYHMFTPLRDDITPLYIITNRNKISSYTVQGIYVPTLLPVFSL